jgi:opacity protein-like surface antigen
MTRTSSCCRFTRSSAAPVAISAFLCIAGAVTPAAAQEWRLEPELRVGGEYDDNARLRSDEAGIVEIDGYIVEGSAGIGYQTQRTNFLLTPTLRSRVYDEEIDVDSDDQFLELDWTHTTLKGQFALRGEYSRESARTAERSDANIDEGDPDSIPTDETGIVFASARRERFRIAPEWQYEFTERMSFDTRFTYIDTAYDDVEQGQLRDYDDMRFTAGLGRQFTPRTRGYIAGSARQFENEDGNNVDGLGVSLGFESEVSETTRLKMEVGVEESEFEGTTESEQKVVGNVSLVRQLETLSMLAQYRRDISPGGSGRVSAKDTLNLSLRKQFTERVSGRLGFRGYKTEGVGEQAVTTFEERDFNEFYAGLDVALSRTVSLEADYRFDQLDETGSEGTAESNSIILWLVYKPTAMVSSR